MVMALHGCEQTNDDVLNDWGLKAAADRYRFILVAPFITSYDGLRNTNCWGFWLDQHRHEGRGEPEDLRRIGQAVEARFGVDANRRYITGLSSGGAMTVVAAVAHNEYWAAAASAAGLPLASTCLAPEQTDEGHHHDQRARRGLAQRQAVDHLRAGEPAEVLHRALVHIGQHRIGAAEGQQRRLGEELAHVVQGAGRQHQHGRSPERQRHHQEQQRRVRHARRSQGIRSAVRTFLRQQPRLRAHALHGRRHHVVALAG